MKVVHSTGVNWIVTSANGADELSRLFVAVGTLVWPLVGVAGQVRRRARSKQSFGVPLRASRYLLYRVSSSAVGMGGANAARLGVCSRKTC